MPTVWSATRRRNRRRFIQTGTNLLDHLVRPIALLSRPFHDPAHLPVQVFILVGGRNASVHHTTSFVCRRHHHVVAPVGQLLDLKFRRQLAGEMQAGGGRFVEAVEASPGRQADASTDNVHNGLLFTINLTVANPDAPAGRIVGYARVSGGEQKPHLEPQANRLWAYAGMNDIAMDSVVSEIASGLNDKRPELLKLLADPGVSTIIVEHRDRLARFGVGMVDAMLQARGGSLVVIDDAEAPDDLVRDMTEILTCFCARLYGKRSAASKAKRAVEAAGG